jgi:hypothetical protein
MSYLTAEQIGVLLRQIKPSRISRVQGMSHLEAYDVRAHMNRLFGFARWSADVLECDLIFEDVHPKDPAKPDGPTVVSVGYRARLRLAVNAPDGTPLATYTEVATGDASNFPIIKRADAHDFAAKTAESQALKRCAINLGDQFGLSLYRKGSTDALVLRTLVGGAEPAVEGVDDDAPDVVPEGVDPRTGEVFDRPRAVPVAELDAAENPADPEAARRARLDEQKVIRDVLGVDSSGRALKGQKKAERYAAADVPGDDPWATPAEDTP